jgi:hypothetical protein
MVQGATCRPFTAEARVCPRVSRCGICDDQNGTGTGFVMGKMALGQDF